MTVLPPQGTIKKPATPAQADLRDAFDSFNVRYLPRKEQLKKGN